MICTLCLPLISPAFLSPLASVLPGPASAHLLLIFTEKNEPSSSAAADEATTRLLSSVTVNTPTVKASALAVVDKGVNEVLGLAVVGMGPC